MLGGEGMRDCYDMSCKRGMDNVDWFSTLGNNVYSTLIHRHRRTIRRHQVTRCTNKVTVSADENM